MDNAAWAHAWTLCHLILSGMLLLIQHMLLVVAGVGMLD